MQTEDQLRRVLELDEASGTFELDEKGYTRFVPSADEEADINRWLGEEIPRADREHEPLFAEWAENQETYKAVKTTISGSGAAILPSPIARNPADQIISSTVNTVMRARPIMSFDAHFPAKYQVAVPMEVPQIDPLTQQQVMQTTAVPVERDSEEVALAFEQGMEFKNRERLDFEGNFHKVVHHCVTGGAVPVWWKVCYKSKQQPLVTPKIKGAFVDFSDKEETYVKGDGVHWYVIPPVNVVRPNLDDDIDDLPWLAEKDPKAPEEITAGFYSKEWFLLKNEEDAKRLSTSLSVTVDPAKQQVDSSTKKHTPEDIRPLNDVREVSFYRYLKVKDGDKTVTKRFLMLGWYHVTARRLLAAYKWPYEHGRRNMVPFSQFLDGSSTVGIVKYHQKVGTHIQQAEIKNAFHANNMLYWWNPDNPDVDTFFRGRKELGPGDFVPGKEGEDWGVVRGGAQHYSLLGLAQWNKRDAQEAAAVSDIESGSDVPNRTPSSTVAQVLERGSQKQVLFLRMLNRGAVKVMRLYLETGRQFSPMGETIPVKDPETEALMMVPMRYPVGEALDNFRISLTAADEAMAKERQPEDIKLDIDLYQQHVGFVMQLVSMIVNPETTPTQAALYQQLLQGEQTHYNRVIAHQRTDKHKFDITKAAAAVAEEKAAIVAQAAEMEAMNAANQAAVGGGAVPQAPGADVNGATGVDGQPGMDMGAPPSPDQSIPQEQPIA